MKVMNYANVRAEVINLLGPLHFRVDGRVSFPVSACLLRGGRSGRFWWMWALGKW